LELKPFNISLSDQPTLADAPNKMNVAYLNAGKGFYNIAKNSEKLSPELLDEIRKQQDSRTMVG
jgi:hypothetical protein